MLELKNICFSADGKQILKDINLRIDDAKFIVITGPNGSGKSTLARIISGILTPDSGQILLDGEDITALGITACKKGHQLCLSAACSFQGCYRKGSDLSGERTGFKHSRCLSVSVRGWHVRQGLHRPRGKCKPFRR